jgi:hypothetical protein
MIDDPDEDAFNHIEMMSRVKQEVIKMTQDREKLLNIERSKVLEEVALRFERARDGCSLDDIIGRRWMDSAAELVRSMKR